VALIRLTNLQATTKSTTQPPNVLKEKEMSQVYRGHRTDRRRIGLKLVSCLIWIISLSLSLSLFLSHSSLALPPLLIYCPQSGPTLQSLQLGASALDLIVIVITRFRGIQAIINL
jgi:hypothetical protein